MKTILSGSITYTEIANKFENFQNNFFLSLHEKKQYLRKYLFIVDTKSEQHFDQNLPPHYGRLSKLKNFKMTLFSMLHGIK